MTSPMPLRHPDSESPGRRFVEYAMDPVTLDGRRLDIVVWLRQDEEGLWRWGLQFTDAESGATRSTAEILRGHSEAELWHSVRALRTHHLRDLYRALG